MERFNRTLAMLRYYVEDKPSLWCLYAPELCYTYNMSVNSTTGTTPFDLVLSRPSHEFTRDHRPQSKARPARAQKNDYVRRMHIPLQKASRPLERTKALYKRDTHHGAARRPKLTHNISGPNRVLGHDRNTIVIQRGQVVERVSCDKVTLALKQAATRSARLEDVQPEHLTAKRTCGRS